MSDRYVKLFSLPQGLYATGSPVLISAGALLKDSLSNQVLAQLKMRNITDREIKAITIRLSAFDTVGQKIGADLEHQYLDLAAARNIDFGQKEPIILPEVATRSFDVAVTEVVFSDNSVWKASGDLWEPLQKPTKLTEIIDDSELLKQYHLTYGNDCNYSTSQVKDLWYCTCGALNHKEEVCCHKCKRNLSDLNKVDFDVLSAERDERVKKEQEIAKEKAEKQKQLLKKLVPLIVVAIIAGALIFGSAKKGNDYNKAVELWESGQEDEAFSIFERLGDYKDSAEYQMEYRYNDALRTMSRNMFNSEDELHEAEIDDISIAYHKLKELPDDYKDVSQLIELCDKYYPYYGVYTVKGDGFRGELDITSNFSYDAERKMVFWKPDGDGDTSIYFGDMDCLGGSLPIQLDGKAQRTYSSSGLKCITRAVFSEDDTIEIQCDLSWKEGGKDQTMIVKFTGEKLF